MPMPETREPHNENPEVVLARWQDRLKILVHKVKVWVEKAGWRTRMIEKPMNDRNLGGTRSLSCSWRRTRSRWP